MAFYSISQKEMEAFLFPQGFKPLKLPNVVELVYGKIITTQLGVKLSLRIYTAINPNGKSREIGSDAIRIQLYWMYNDQPRMVGKCQKCLRVTNWKENMTAAIDRQGDADHYQVCPRCKSPMVIREANGGEFWGCSTYRETKCNGKPPRPGEVVTEPQSRMAIMHEMRSGDAVPKIGNSARTAAIKTVMANPATFTNPPKSQKTINPYRIADDQISDHQRAVENYFNSENGNIIMGARAGSGKTTMLKHLASFRPAGKSMVYLAFGKKNATEGKKKLPREVASLTTHKFCGGWLRDHYKMPEKSDQNKNWQIMEDVYPGMKNKTRRLIRKAAFRLIGLAKNFAIRPGDMDGLKAVMDQYTFELEEDKEVETVLEITNEVLQKSLPGKTCGLSYDFDDMLWWPIVMDFMPPKYDYVLADECQDFNACQIELLRRMEERGSRIIAVGDPFQAVFRFRGADSDAYDKLEEMLSATKRGYKELILPTSYRNGRTIIEYVRNTTVVKDIQAAPNAVEGKVIEDMTYCDVLQLIVSEMAAA